ncbi:MAG: hypothetical protein EOO38_25955 [Cytophagaceae bacterium]|nr:MAG: hypothetical protein EOO38_25955 [Cytophagaceae bacterium]
MAHNLQKESVRFKAVIAVEDMHCTMLVHWAARASGRLTQHRLERQAVVSTASAGTRTQSTSTMTASSIEALAAMQACETSARAQARSSTRKAAHCAAFLVLRTDISITEQISPPSAPLC